MKPGTYVLYKYTLPAIVINKVSTSTKTNKSTYKFFVIYHKRMTGFAISDEFLIGDWRQESDETKEMVIKFMIEKLTVKQLVQFKLANNV